MTKPEKPSYVDFTRIYSKNLNIISNSNADITVLSATSEASNLNNVEIILQGTGTTNLVVQMPDNSKMYSAKLNGAECNLAQTNGKLNINLNLDSGHTEQSLCIYFSQSSPSQQSQQSSQQSQSNPSQNQQQSGQQNSPLLQNLILRHQVINLILR